MRFWKGPRKEYYTDEDIQSILDNYANYKRLQEIQRKKIEFYFPCINYLIAKLSRSRPMTEERHSRLIKRIEYSKKKTEMLKAQKQKLE